MPLDRRGQVDGEELGGVDRSDVRIEPGPQVHAHARTPYASALVSGGVIDGAHVILNSNDPDADRAALRDVLGFPHVDVGGGWLIFALPPAEVAVHPTDGPPSHELYLMCDDVEATVADLTAAGIEVTKPVEDQGWGLLTSIRLPGGSELGLYQPRHDRPPQA